MCDPTKTPPGGTKSQAAGVAAINTPAASKPKADDTSENIPSENVPSANTPSGDTSTDISGSVPTLDVHPSSTNPKKVASKPEHRLSPVQLTPTSHKAQNDPPLVSHKSPSSSLHNDETTPSENDDDLMTSSSPSNNDDFTSISSQDKTASSSVTNKITSPPSTIKPGKQLIGNSEQNHVGNHVEPSSTAPSSHKGVHVKLGPPLYVSNPKIKQESSLQNKVTNTRLTPLIDNYHKELMVPKGMKVPVKRSNSMKNYIQSKKAVKKDGITIKLPTIPPCPDMKNYHWPWNCLGGSSLNLNILLFLHAELTSLILDSSISFNYYSLSSVAKALI